jgi:hypothetical protein
MNPQTPTAKRLTRDQRLQVLTLQRIGKSYIEIAIYLGLTKRAV